MVVYKIRVVVRIENRSPEFHIGKDTCVLRNEACLVGHNVMAGDSSSRGIMVRLSNWIIYF